MIGKVALGVLTSESRETLAVLVASTKKSKTRLKEPLTLLYCDLSKEGVVCALVIPVHTETSLFAHSKSVVAWMVVHLSRTTDVTFFVSGTRQISVMSDGMLEECNPREWAPIRSILRPLARTEVPM